MTRIAELAEQAVAVAAALRLEAALITSAGTPAQWAEAVAAVEWAGRAVDAVRVAVLAPAVGDGRAVPEAVAAVGSRSGVDAVSRLAGIGEPEARRRLLVAEAVSGRVAVSGAGVPPRLAALAEALGRARIGVEAAAVIARELDRVRPRAATGDLLAAEAGLVALAAGRARDEAVDGDSGDTGPDAGDAWPSSPLPVEFVLDAARHWAAAIDPDGARPREERMMRRRCFRIGPEDQDGLIPVSGRLALESGLTLRALLEAHRRAGAEVAFADAGEVGAAGGGAASSRDERTREQQLHDALAAAIGAAARAADAPTLAGAAPAVVVTVAAEDLEDPEGRAGDPVGRADGSATPLSRREVDSLIDRAGLQRVVLTAQGAVAGISSVQRCFTPSQRRAIAARDGGCVIPGCRIPAGWCEAHHVVPWRDGGATETSNGVLLCWWHHSRIDTGPWRLRMVAGVPQARGPGVPEWAPHRPRHRAHEAGRASTAVPSPGSAPHRAPMRI